MLAAKLVGHTGDITRFPDRDHFASYTGTAPVEASSGDVRRHRLNRGGNRQLNTALHLIAVCQIRDPSPGQAYYQRKLAQAKTPEEARRSLKRHLANVVYAHLIADHRCRHAGLLTHRGAIGSLRPTGGCLRALRELADRSNARQLAGEESGQTSPGGHDPDHRREDFLYTLKAGPAGGRLRRPSSAGSDTTVTGAPASPSTQGGPYGRAQRRDGAGGSGPAATPPAGSYPAEPSLSKR